MASNFGLTTIKPGPVELLMPASFDQAKKLRDDLIWQQLDCITVAAAIELWLSTLNPKTKLNYRSGLRKLVELGLIDQSQSLQAFALINHDTVLDQIKLIPEWAECSRQARAACYISFTRFLTRQTQGIVSKAIPSKEGTSKTFFRVYEKVKTAAMSQAQWIRFFEALEKLSLRECLIAKVILQGAKRVSEVLSLQADQIDWDRRKISFVQSKTKGLLKETVITYPDGFMNRLQVYLGERTGHVFVTRFGKPVDLRWVAEQFSKARKLAGISIKVSPHVLLASTVKITKFC